MRFLLSFFSILAVVVTLSLAAPPVIAASGGIANVLDEGYTFDLQINSDDIVATFRSVEAVSLTGAEGAKASAPAVTIPLSKGGWTPTGSGIRTSRSTI